MIAALDINREFDTILSTVSYILVSSILISYELECCNSEIIVQMNKKLTVLVAIIVTNSYRIIRCNDFDKIKKKQYQTMPQAKA